MNKQEKEERIKHLNQGKPYGHEAISLKFNEEGCCQRVISCSCGRFHPIGGIDSEFVLWDQSTLREISHQRFSTKDTKWWRWK